MAQLNVDRLEAQNLAQVNNLNNVYKAVTCLQTRKSALMTPPPMYDRADQRILNENERAQTWDKVFPVMRVPMEQSQPDSDQKRSRSVARKTRRKLPRIRKDQLISAPSFAELQLNLEDLSKSSSHSGVDVVYQVISAQETSVPSPSLPSLVQEVVAMVHANPVNVVSETPSGEIGLILPSPIIRRSILVAEDLDKTFPAVNFFSQSQDNNSNFISNKEKSSLPTDYDMEDQCFRLFVSFALFDSSHPLTVLTDSLRLHVKFLVRIFDFSE